MFFLGPQWTIIPADHIGFYIQHTISGLYLAIDKTEDDGHISMTMHDTGCVFLFEPGQHGAW